MTINIGLGNGLELYSFITNNIPPRERLAIKHVFGSSETRLDLGSLTIQNIDYIIGALNRLKIHASDYQCPKPAYTGSGCEFCQGAPDECRYCS